MPYGRMSQVARPLRHHVHKICDGTPRNYFWQFLDSRIRSAYFDENVKRANNRDYNYRYERI